MNKVVFIREALSEDVANNMIALTLYLDSLDKKRIYYWLNCPGGDVSGHDMIDRRCHHGYLNSLASRCTDHHQHMNMPLYRSRDRGGTSATCPASHSVS
jgi:hypothetical protein